MPLCFNLIACSSGDNSAVSEAVNPVFVSGAEATCSTTGFGCSGKGGVLIFASCAWSAETNFEIGAKITRTIGGSEVDTLIGDASSSRTRAFLSERSNAAGDYGTMPMVLLDSPNTTSEITYKPVAATEGSATLYLNRHHDDSDATVPLDVHQLLFV